MPESDHELLANSKGYRVLELDRRLGSVSEVICDADGEPEHLVVRRGPFRHSIMLPIARVIDVDVDHERVLTGPTPAGSVGWK